uniref:hypothetical protein n=1 Tax=Bacillus cytotoxicus TaxID=580165 RepID=UPI002042468B
MRGLKRRAGASVEHVMFSIEVIYKLRNDKKAPFLGGREQLAMRRSEHGKKKSGANGYFLYNCYIIPE